MYESNKNTPKKPHHCYGEESYLSKAYCRDISFTYISVISINQNKCSENKYSIFYQNIQRTKNVGAIIHKTSYSLLLVNFRGNCHSVEVFGVVFCGSRFVFLSFLSCLLCYSSFDLRLLITPLVFSNCSYPSIKKQKQNKKPTNCHI